MDPISYLLAYGAVSLLGVGVTVLLFRSIKQGDSEHAKAEYIASLIRKGAMAFLAKEYSILLGVVAVTFVILTVVFNGACGFAYTLGAFSSMFAGFIGMRAATIANVATTLAAKDKGEKAAFLTALRGGSVMGFVVATIGLFGLSLIFHLFIHSVYDFVQIISSFGLGASSIALFARVGGGIFTKAADVGADLVGKIELSIPEDDPRNPAVIADNVGDCVGDTAGMGADIYESYVGACIATMALAYEGMNADMLYMTLPITLSAIGLVASVVGLG